MSAPTRTRSLCTACSAAHSGHGSGLRKRRLCQRPNSAPVRPIAAVHTCGILLRRWHHTPWPRVAPMTGQWNSGPNTKPSSCCDAGHTSAGSRKRSLETGCLLVRLSADSSRGPSILLFHPHGGRSCEPNQRRGFQRNSCLAQGAVRKCFGPSIEPSHRSIAARMCAGSQVVLPSSSHSRPGRSA